MFHSFDEAHKSQDEQVSAIDQIHRSDDSEGFDFRTPDKSRFEGSAESPLMDQLNDEEKLFESLGKRKLPERSELSEKLAGSNSSRVIYVAFGNHKKHSTSIRSRAESLDYSNSQKVPPENDRLSETSTMLRLIEKMQSEQRSTTLRRTQMSVDESRTT